MVDSAYGVEGRQAYEGISSLGTSMYGARDVRDPTLRIGCTAWCARTRKGPIGGHRRTNLGMRISRLILDATATEPELEIEFPIDVAIVDGDPSELHRIRFALASLLDGWNDFGRAFVQIEGIEIEVTDEMAPLIGARLDGRRDFVDAKTAASVIDPLPSESPDIVALRAALELGSSILHTLDVAAIDRALNGVDDDRDSTVLDAHDRVDAAIRRRDEAAELVDMLESWSQPLEAAHRGTELARQHGGRRFSGLFSSRRIRDALDAEDELLGAAGFSSFEDFSASLAHVRTESDRAAAAAETIVVMSDPLVGSIHGASKDGPASQALAARELALRLRRRQLITQAEMAPDEATSVTNCLRALLRAGGRAVDSSTTADEVVAASIEWLGEAQAGTLRHLLAERGRRSAENVAVLGPTPLVLDRAFVGLDPVAIRHALGGLDPYLDAIQVVSIGFDEEVSRWAEGRYT